MYIYHIFLIHSSVEGYLGWFHNLANVNQAATNIDVAASLYCDDFKSFWYTPRSGIAGLNGGSTGLLRYTQANCISIKFQKVSSDFPFQLS